MESPPKGESMEFPAESESEDVAAVTVHSAMFKALKHIISITC